MGPLATFDCIEDRIALRIQFNLGRSPSIGNFKPRGNVFTFEGSRYAERGNFYSLGSCYNVNPCSQPVILLMATCHDVTRLVQSGATALSLAQRGPLAGFALNPEFGDRQRRCSDTSLRGIHEG